MSNNHSVRDHATWSASATERLWACPGSLALSQTVSGREGSNPAADWGTCCHQVSEKCLRQNKDAAEFIGTTEHGKQHSFEVDDEMAETAQTYVDYVRDQVAKGAKLLCIEQQFSLDELKTPFDAGGTADAVLYHIADRMLEVVDLKGGKGVVVEVTENKQLRTYALGVVLAHRGLDVEKVKVTIVQPRAGHKDGRIRSETFHVADLVEWTADLLGAMRRAKLAQVMQGQEKGWAEAYLNTGQHCRFCPAAGFCPALKTKALEKAQVWFDDEGTGHIPNSPDRLMPEDIAQILDHADLIQDWLNAVRAYAHAQAESGVAIPGYQLVAKQARRKWDDEEAVKERLFLRADLTDDEITVRKLMSPAQLERLLGKPRAKELLADLWEAKSTGTNLVAATKTTRPAVRPAVETYFDTHD